MILEIKRKYLNIPVKGDGQNKVKMFLKNIEGNILRYFDFVPGLDESDFIAFYNVEEYLGQKLEITLENADKAVTKTILASIEQTDSPQGFDGLYSELERPQLHFSSRRGWLNDPNGLVNYFMQWHLFYQHNPFGTGWGNMHWGHAVSQDLMHWEELDTALFPDASGTMYSGSAVVDWHNSSKLQNGEDPPVLLFYTSAGEHAPEPTDYTQGMAYSTDGGMSFTKYPDNPLIPCITPKNRDPKVIRHDPTDGWIMVLYLEKDGDDQVFVLFRSKNLLEWEMLHKITISGAGECPELFELPVDGDYANPRWVFSAADGKYLIGEFDGFEFKPESEVLDSCFRPADGGAYAFQRWNDTPGNRKIMIGWQQGNIPAREFNMSMSLPVELSLRTFPEGPRLCFEPVRELLKLKKKCLIDIFGSIFSTESAINTELERYSDQLMLVQLKVRTSSECGIKIHGNEFIFKPAENVIKLNDIEFKPVEIFSEGAIFNVSMIIDVNSVEMFSANGRDYWPRQLNVNPQERGMRLSSGEGVIVEMIVHSLKSIWN